MENETQNILNKKCVIYSAITGDYDEPIEHDIPAGWEYKLFTNNPKIKATDYIACDLDNQKFARYIKTCPFDFFDYDICVWVDGNTTINKENLLKIIDNDFVVSKHPRWDCIYREAQEIINHKKADPDLINKIVERYKKEGVPKEIGMSATHGLIRHNKKYINDFCRMWWKEIEENSHRDQMSFDYLLWKTQTPVLKIPFYKKDYNSVFIIKRWHLLK